MISVVLHTGPGLDDYSLHLVNALAEYARVAYSIDARQKARFGSALSSRVTPLVFQRPRRRELWGFQEMARQARAIRQFKPDIFHLQGDGIWESVLAGMLGALPVINTVHDPVKHMDQRTWLNNALMRAALRRACGWVVHSQAQKKFLCDKFSLNEDRVLVHPHGVLDYYCRFQPERARGKNMLFFGQFRLNKGYDCLLRAFDACKQQLPDWRLVMAGNGPLVEAAQTAMHHLGPQLDLRNRFIADGEVAELFASAGLVVLPYREGTQSGVLAIAAAFNCPVLATTVGSLPEILEHGKQVYFIEPDNEAALSAGLVRLAHDEELRGAIGKGLGELGRNQWQWPALARQTLDFYARVQQAA